MHDFVVKISMQLSRLLNLWKNLYACSTFTSKTDDSPHRALLCRSWVEVGKSQWTTQWQYPRLNSAAGCVAGWSGHSTREAAHVRADSCDVHRRPWRHMSITDGSRQIAPCCWLTRLDRVAPVHFWLAGWPGGKEGEREGQSCFGPNCDVERFYRLFLWCRWDRLVLKIVKSWWALYIIRDISEICFLSKHGWWF